MTKSLEPATLNDIEIIPGNTNILLIAPHGVESEPYDDEKTAELTKEIQRHLECDAIINATFRKPDDTKKSVPPLRGPSHFFLG